MEESKMKGKNKCFYGQKEKEVNKVKPLTETPPELKKKLQKKNGGKK